MESHIQEDLQKLIEYSVDSAERLLQDFKEYYPFGAKITKEGKLIPVNFHDGDEFPESQTVIDGLSGFLQKELKAEIIRSFCIVYDVRVTNDDFPETIDAILVAFTSADNESRKNYYYPYKLHQDSVIEYFEPWAETE